ncbi:SAM-dependent methyltransferase [Salinivibrio kushneri]|uniref:class I SAM-dependent methyltransferase n=1 Tax=Salinivibrio kushneri TaxID=1908198 RepID=UPI0009882EE5|nr:class I SAM-dependent methyltransferase [Salinivibrio kushneri]OOE39541.1 SAM-dependent methyltransferase [Salinivibrio kushneri]
MDDNKTELLSEVADYYSNKLASHGNTPQGVDWNGGESQFLRFEQLCRIINSHNDRVSVNDLGCGYGALLDFLTSKYKKAYYTGVDVSPEMIKAAQLRHQSNSNAQFIVGSRPDVKADFGIASGIFNVRLGQNDSKWFEYLEDTLDTLNSTSLHGFAFNCLTSYSDEDKKRDYLYYADPCKLFELCKRKYSRNVALLHDYGLYEFTILVRKADD